MGLVSLQLMRLVSLIFRLFPAKSNRSNRKRLRITSVQVLIGATLSSPELTAIQEGFVYKTLYRLKKDSIEFHLLNPPEESSFFLLSLSWSSSPPSSPSLALHLLLLSVGILPLTITGPAWPLLLARMAWTASSLAASQPLAAWKTSPTLVPYRLSWTGTLLAAVHAGMWHTLMVREARKASTCLVSTLDMGILTSPKLRWIISPTIKLINLGGSTLMQYELLLPTADCECYALEFW